MKKPRTKSLAGRKEDTNLEKKLKMIGFMILGNAILAMGTAAFVVPNGLISGGVTGIGLILQRLFGLPVDIGVFAAYCFCWVRR